MMSPEKPEIKPPETAMNAATIFVCILCGQEKGRIGPTPGARLYDALQNYLTQIKPENFPARVQKVKCLGGCNHPCAVAVAGPGKITYMYGDLPGGTQTDEVVAALETYMRQYAESARGYVPPLEKPELFRPVLVRIPDLDFVSETGMVTLPVGAVQPVETAVVDDAPPFASPLRRADDDV